MPSIKINGLPTDKVRNLQRGGKDANGFLPEVHVSNGRGNPCRHCLEMIEKGEEFLILSYKPFESTQPYAEQGPIFLHRRECSPAVQENDLPPVLKASSEFLVRGYDEKERIVYGTGKVLPNTDITTYASKLLKEGGVEFVHVRSARNNCYQARIERSDND